MIKELLRIIVALIFLASGFVKAIDLRGFSFKMEEYFSPSVFNMPFLQEYALTFAVVVVVLELVLGLMLLLKMKLKCTLIALILLCVFFGFLTFYSAYFNVVTDCGCFGDAIKFTPWESFIKDIILLVALVILYLLYRNHVEKDSKINNTQWSIFGITSLIFVYIMYHGLVAEPLIDFRAYKIGTNIIEEKEKIAANPSEYKTFYSLKNKQNGTIIKVDQDEYVSKQEYWADGSPWEIEDGKTTSELVKEGYLSEITKFEITDPTGQDITSAILQAKKAVIVFSYKPKEADNQVLQQLEKKLQKLQNTSIHAVSPEGNIFKTLPNGSMDATAIKTIARSNPFVLVLENGIIKEKLPATDYLK